VADLKGREIGDGPKSCLGLLKAGLMRPEFGQRTVFWLFHQHLRLADSQKQPLNERTPIQTVKGTTFFLTPPLTGLIPTFPTIFLDYKKTLFIYWLLSDIPNSRGENEEDEYCCQIFLGRGLTITAKMIFKKQVRFLHNKASILQRER